jgi:hypothetical protein
LIKNNKKDMFSSFSNIEEFELKTKKENIKNLNTQDRVIIFKEDLEVCVFGSLGVGKR